MGERDEKQEVRLLVEGEILLVVGDDETEVEAAQRELGHTGFQVEEAWRV